MEILAVISMGGQLTALGIECRYYEAQDRMTKPVGTSMKPFAGSSAKVLATRAV